MTTYSFQGFSEKINSAQSEAELKVVCEQFCEAANFEYYIYAVCSVTSLSAPQIHCLSNYPESWFNRYFSDELQKHDPVVKYCFDNISPICWDQLMTMEKYIDPIGVELMQSAAEFGLVNGMSIPIKSPSSEVAIFSLATKNSKGVQQRLLDVLPHAQMFSLQLFEVYSRINQEVRAANAYKLTSRELECLFWACEGKTTWEISKIVDVTERTIVFHLSSATKKLGAVNRQHAVAKAIISGLVKPAP